MLFRSVTAIGLTWSTIRKASSISTVPSTVCLGCIWLSQEGIAEIFWRYNIGSKFKIWVLVAGEYVSFLFSQKENSLATRRDLLSHFLIVFPSSQMKSISHEFCRELFFIFQIISMNLLCDLHLTQRNQFSLICKQVDFMAGFSRLLIQRIVRPKLFGKCSKSYLRFIIPLILHVMVIKAQILILIHRVENIIRNFHSAGLCSIFLADSVQALFLGSLNPGTFCIITAVLSSSLCTS